MATSSSIRDRPILRFAPSPNGRLHLGHALSALTNRRFADVLGGALLLRLEDIDLTRCRPKFEQAIHEDLAWLGLRFEGEVRRQSQHFADYEAALDRLRNLRLLYPCFCSRQDVKLAVEAQAASPGSASPCDPDGAPLYPGPCRSIAPGDAARRIAAGEPHLLRLDMTRARLAASSCDGAEGAEASLGYQVFDEAGQEHRVAAHPDRWGDVVLARKDVPTSYHLSVVVDDALQGVSHVVRGRDLEAATDIHVVLQRLLRLPTPRYHFHPLLQDQDGLKLAKSRGSESLADLRARGATAAEIRARLGFA